MACLAIFDFGEQLAGELPSWPVHGGEGRHKATRLNVANFCRNEAASPSQATRFMPRFRFQADHRGFARRDYCVNRGDTFATSVM